MGDEILITDLPMLTVECQNISIKLGFFISCRKCPTQATIIILSPTSDWDDNYSNPAIYEIA